jgi:hypothetical protein
MTAALTVISAGDWFADAGLKRAEPSTD